MGLTLVSPPATEPISLEEAKSHLRIVHSTLDDVISGLIVAAREYVESITGRQLITATYRLTARKFPSVTGLNRDALLFVPKPPLQYIESLKYRDATGALLTLAADVDYRLDPSSEPAAIETARTWPTTGNFPDAMQLQFVAGYPPGDGNPTDPALNVPARAKAAIKQLVVHWMDFSGPLDTGFRTRPLEIPHHVSRLLRSLRVRDL